MYFLSTPFTLNEAVSITHPANFLGLEITGVVAAKEYGYY